jgi:peroxiredoxin
MTKKVLLIIAAFTLATAAGVGGFYMYQSLAPQATVQEQAAAYKTNDDDIIGSTRPDFSLSDVAGQIRNISEWDGKVLAINFWATWCPPCIKEIPEFIEIQHKYEAQGLQFIGIALQRPEEVIEFMQTHGMNYPVLAGEMEVIKIAESYGNDIGALPYTVIVDRAGHIHYVKRGPLAGDTAEAIISKLL